MISSSVPVASHIPGYLGAVERDTAPLRSLNSQ